MTNGYRTSVIFLVVSMFHGQLGSAEPATQEKAQQEQIGQSKQNDDKNSERIKKLLPVTAPESELAIKKFSLDNNSDQKTQPLIKAKSKSKNTQAKDKQFIPTETISEDLSVSFPVDI